MNSIHDLATGRLPLFWCVFALVAVLGALAACAGQATAPGQTEAGTAAPPEAAPAAEESAASIPTGPQTCTLELWAENAWTKRAELPCPPDGKQRLLVAGDMGRAGIVLDKSAAGMQRACAEQPCQLLLMPGDLIYGPGAKSEKSWNGAWDKGLARLGLPALAVLGNHEYRHEPDPHLKRAVLYASDKRLGLVLPAPSYAARLVSGQKVLLAFAGLDTDSVAVGQPEEHPGLGHSDLKKACSEQAPVIVIGHHPPSSQGYHHIEESHVEGSLRRIITSQVRAMGCNVVAIVAGHDHDLQAYGPGCEQEGLPAVVVAGATARGFRKKGSDHLKQCPSSDAQSSYHGGLGKKNGGFAILDLDLAAGQAKASLVYTPELDKSQVLDVVSWQFPVP